MIETTNYLNNLGLNFERIVQSCSSHAAIRFITGEIITYNELNTRANQIANYFKKSGIKKYDVVAIFNDKTLNDFASMLACLKIGAIYTNLDYMNPSERLLKILAICKPKIILYHSHTFPHKKLNEANWKDYDGDFLKEIQTEDTRNLTDTALLHGNTPAYLMFTSGSTGFPKGAVMTHDNVMRFIKWAGRRFNITENDILANINPIYFDNSVFDFYASLFHGASVVPIPSAILKKPKDILDNINKMECTIWFSVPSLLVYLLNLKILDSDHFKNIRRIIFGGEGFPKPKLKELVDHFPERITFTNVYGPTECTCICSSYDLAEEDLNNLDGILPLGPINPDFEYLILDETGMQVKPGDTGELCLLGPCVGKGYFGNTELTSKAFKQNPYCPDITDLMYSTGDLVYKNAATKMLHFVARKDNQIKLQGYRIELDEIEAALYNLGYINEVAVIHAKTDIAGKIMAAIVLRIEKTEIEIINDLRKLLPEYMIPKKLILKDCLPKNQNGKIDRMLLASECLL